VAAAAHLADGGSGRGRRVVAGGAAADLEILGVVARGGAETMTITKVPKLGSMVCCLDVEVSEGDWQTIKRFDNYRQAATLAEDLNNAGINATVSCACGSYEYGECELCNAELEEVE
jgi:hypothetical protein